jgi:tripartite-type tricarboxylate transporter receptor subunit TctC
MLTRRIVSTALLATFVAFSLQGSAQAQGYPNRPVRLVLPFAAGGVADVTARIVADKLGEKLGQRFVVENQPGPGGIAAARAVLTAPADGHTLAMLTNGTAVSVPLFKNLSFDPLKDFTPISILGLFDLVVVTNAETKFATLADFLKAAREQPGKLNIGTINIGSTQNLSAELLKATTGIDVAIIPFRATPDAVVALLRNDVQIVIDIYAGLRAGLSDNKLKALAVTGTARTEALPNVPTAIESGVAGYEVTSWNALYAAAGTPPAIVAQLNQALREILSAPDLKKRFAEFGIEAKPSTPAELDTRMRGDIAKWGAVIEKAKIPQQ